MSEENQSETQTKQSFREKVWLYMAKEELSNSLRSLCNRIPYFKGATEATQKLTELEQFKEAKLIMISPDKPQESVIIQSLLKEKEVLIPRPRLMSGLFFQVKNVNNLSSEETKNAVTRHNIKQVETPVGFDKNGLKVDMIVLGSVCVNKAGFRIGTGQGFADLEYAILSKMKAVDENTLVVTTVHDCQILDDLPNEIFECHDVPVDVIVTPTQTIFVNPKLNKPNEIFWSKISKRRFEAISVLQEIKKADETEEKTISLKEEDSDVESQAIDRTRIQKLISKMYPKLKRTRSNTDSALKENEKNKQVRRRTFLRKKRIQKSKENDENTLQTPMMKENQSATVKPKRLNSSRSQVDFSLRLSNIASTVRVRDLKNALLERGVKPSNITWRGQRGFCYLHFGKLRKKNDQKEDQPVQVDSIVANLQQLKIGEASVADGNAFIIVEPAEPVTRIEVTDVSAV